MAKMVGLRYLEEVMLWLFPIQAILLESGMFSNWIRRLVNKLLWEKLLHLKPIVFIP